MSTNLGFGTPRVQPKATKKPNKRAEASKEYDRMKTDGVPDFEIYIRIEGKKQWYPVGVIAVKRSSQINQAIFANQEELLKGAFRIYPILRKHQQQLEYGYRLKEFKDEPIQLAVQPSNSITGGVQNLLAQVQDRISFLFKGS
ncbi:MAG: HHL1-like protein [Leptolyngbyaceae cyanobacterium bins.59]|nr:HHL1-like protein [Leptolyngbyaceae cyanobacterium bins.59]